MELLTTVKMLLLKLFCIPIINYWDSALLKYVACFVYIVNWKVEFFSTSPTFKFQ